MSDATRRSGRRAQIIACVLVAPALSVPALRAQGAAAPSVADPHAHHHPAAPRELRRSEVHYDIPNVQLLDQDGRARSLQAILAPGDPIVVNFIYTTCTTICPLSSQVLAQLQEKLASESAHARLVSISIDPEEDTPARLREYARKFHASGIWSHYTGTVAASVAAQRAFDVYRGDKMNHEPVTLMQSADASHWVRLDGFATAEELLAEVHRLAKP